MSEGADRTFIFLGKTWRVKSLFRLLFVILFLHVIALYFYFTDTSSIVEPFHSDDNKELDNLLVGLNHDVSEGKSKSESDDIDIDDTLSSNSIVLDLPVQVKNENPLIKSKQEYVTVLNDHLEERLTQHKEKLLSPKVAYPSSFTSPSSTKTDDDDDDELDIDLYTLFAGNRSSWRNSHHRNPNQRKYPDRLEDPNHPQYSAAFPRNTKPLHLLNWTRSNESDIHFQPIDGREAWAYSAFYDNRDEDAIVRVFGLTHRNHTGVVYCYFLHSNKEFLLHQKGRLGRMRDSHGSSHSAMEIICKVKRGLNPSYVQITYREDTTFLSNLVKIQYRTRQSRNFTVCFPPLHSNFNQTDQFIQIIELSRVLGANHFFVYNFSVSSGMNQILQMYENDGVVTVLPWPLPTVDSWYYGQILAINDCIYRNMGVSRFVVVSDTDEIIIPHVHLSWMSLLENVVKHSWQRDDEFMDPDLAINDETYQHIFSFNEELDKLKQSNREKLKADREERKFKSSNINNGSKSNVKNKPFSRARNVFPSKSRINRKSRRLLDYDDSSDDPSEDLIDGNDNFFNDSHLQFGSYSFRCAFYCQQPLELDHMKRVQLFQFTSTEKNMYFRLARCPILSLLHTEDIFDHGVRSKVIVQPDAILYCGIHKVILHREGYKTAYVEPEIAILHHYRDYKLPTCNMLDVSVLTFKDKFFQLLKLTMEKISFLST